MLIDHSHAFTGNAWTPADLRADRPVTNKLLEEWPGQSRLNEEERRAIAHKAPSVAATFGRITLQHAVLASFVGYVLDAARQRALVEFLDARSQHVGQSVACKVGFPVML